jgi:3-oxo-5-alpha-steroid 4-dehydrogenase 3
MPAFINEHDYFSREFSMVYFLLGISVLTVPFIPFLESLACHGKRKRVKSVHEDLVDKVKLNTEAEAGLLLLPKSFFIHMYAVGSIMITCCYYLLFDRIVYKDLSYDYLHLFQSTAFQGVLMFQVHCLRRLWECLYITKYGSSSMDISAYFLGIAHYVITPLCITCSLLRNDDLVLIKGSNLRLLFRIGSILFYIAGNLSQFWCHSILFKLKQRKEKNAIFKKMEISYGDQKHSYSFPHGYGFDHVACPHYLAEISIYCSFWCLSPTSLSLFTMLFWVINNLSVSASAQYSWYEEYFPEEFKLKAKKGWKRLIPKIW